MSRTATETQTLPPRRVVEVAVINSSRGGDSEREYLTDYYVMLLSLLPLPLRLSRCTSLSCSYRPFFSSTLRSSAIFKSRTNDIMPVPTVDPPYVLSSRSADRCLLGRKRNIYPLGLGHPSIIHWRANDDLGLRCVELKSK